MGDSSNEDSGEKISELEDEELLESWVQWKQPTIREALMAMDKVGVPDWADEKKAGCGCGQAWTLGYEYLELDADWISRSRPPIATVGTAINSFSKLNMMAEFG